MAQNNDNQANPILQPENITNLVGIGTKQEDFESVPSNNKDYNFLGKGAFGFVEKMKSKLNNKFYAIKKLPVKKEAFDKEFIRETIFMLTTNNQYVVKLYGYFQGMEKIEKLKDIYKDDKNGRYQNDTEDKKMYFLVEDCMSKNSLDKYYKECREKSIKIDQNFIIKVFKQILIGLKALHDKQIMHRDIKLDNILMDENGDIKISDFGISAIHQEGNEESNSNPLISNYTRVGRKDFVAPEILNETVKDFDLKVDIFSLGLSMLCLISNLHPISFQDKKRIISILDIDGMYNKYLVNLIKKMLLKNPLLRPDAGEALLELERIEKYINNPTPENEKKIHSAFEPEHLSNLTGIGVKPEDFEPIKSKNGDNYTILGKGISGYCELMKSKLNNKLYAIKRLPVKAEMPKEFKRETTLMFKVNHKNVIRLYGYFQCIEKIEKLKNIYKDSKNRQYQDDTTDKKMYFLVLDYMSNGSIDDYYEKVKKEKKDFEQSFILKIFEQILAGLRYLHGLDIIHRDIKPDNLLLDDNFNIKISDFGYSALMKGNEYEEQRKIDSNMVDPLVSNLTHIGPNVFGAPELRNKNAKFDLKIDIFGLGLTMFCLICKDNPITMKNNIRTINWNNISNIYNPYLVGLIKRMIQDNPNFRPDADSAYNELKKIEAFIKDPSNQKLKEHLDNKNLPQNYQNQIPNQSFISNNNQTFNPNNNKYSTVNQNTNINNQMYPNNNQGNNYVNINNKKYQTGSINQPNNQNMNMVDYFNISNMPPNNLYMPYYFNNNLNNNFGYMRSSSGNVFPQTFPNQINKMSFSMDYIYSMQYKNSSLWCVLKCLYYCMKDNLDNIISNINYICANNPNFMSMSMGIISILSMVKLMESEPQNQNDLIKLNNYIKSFRFQFSDIIKSFQGTEEISPYKAYYETFSKLNEYSRIYAFSNPSNNIKKLEMLNGIDRDEFPDVFGDIQNFKKQKESPFVDYFYYVQIETKECRSDKCHSLNAADVRWGNIIEFQAAVTGKVSDFIANYFKLTTSDNYYDCNTCLINDKQIQQTLLLSRPKFLVIHFSGNQISPKNLEPLINVSTQSFPNNDIGPKIYSLYAFIFKNVKTNAYCAFIKKPDSWYYYNDGLPMKSNITFFNAVYPSLVFYKGEY